MTDYAAPKSAYELAMERLRKTDADAGLERQLVTARKAAVSEIRCSTRPSLPNGT